MFLRFMNSASRFCFAEEGGDKGGAGGGGGGKGAEGGNDGGKAGGEGKGADDGGKGSEGAEGGSGGGDSLLDGADDEGGEGGESKPVDFSKGMPEGFPADAWDAKENKPKADVLYDALKKQEKIAADLRAKMGKGDHKPPKTAEEYKFTPSEKTQGIMEKDDPIIKAAAPIAHKYGLSKEQFQGFLNDMGEQIAGLREAASKEAPKEPTEEEKTAYRKAEYAKIGTNAPQVIKAVESWGRELHSQGILSESELKTFKTMAQTGDDVRVLNKLRAQAGGGTEMPMEAGTDSLPSDREIANMLDKAYAAKDENEVKRIEDKYYPMRQAAGRPAKLAI